MLHEHPELGDSLGKMTAAYIDDINYSMSGLGDSARDGDIFPSPYADNAHRANFGNDGALNFLSVVEQNEESHQEFASNAQHIYTLSLLEQNPPGPGPPTTAPRTPCSWRRRSVACWTTPAPDQAATDLGVEADDYNKKLDLKADWVKWGVGGLIGGGVALIPGGQGAGAVLIPLAAGPSAPPQKEFINGGIDNVADGYHKDPGQDAQMSRNEFYSNGATTLGQDYEYYFKGHENRPTTRRSRRR